MIDEYIRSIEILEKRLSELEKGCPKGCVFADWLQRKSLLKDEINDLYDILNHLLGKSRFGSVDSISNVYRYLML